MKLSDTNIIKTIDNFNEIKQKAISLIKEMGFKNEVDENNVILFVKDDFLIFRNPLYGEEYKLPITYFLDKEGIHENEYKTEKEKQEQLELGRLKNYLK